MHFFRKTDFSARRRSGLRVALAAGTAASAFAITGPASADPLLPGDVWLQCTGFSGPTTTWPHPLTGCTARSGEGSGYTFRTAPGTETIQWNGTFLGGQSMALTNIHSSFIGFLSSCPADHPVAVAVGGVIGGVDGLFAGSSVSATICSSASDFLLMPGTLFTIHKAEPLL